MGGAETEITRCSWRKEFLMRRQCRPQFFIGRAEYAHQTCRVRGHWSPSFFLVCSIMRVEPQPFRKDGSVNPPADVDSSRLFRATSFEVDGLAMYSGHRDWNGRMYVQFAR